MILIIVLNKNVEKNQNSSVVVVVNVKKMMRMTYFSG
jgi:hypothetical protein